MTDLTSRLMPEPESLSKSKAFKKSLLKKITREFHRGFKRIRAALRGMTVSEFDNDKRHRRWLKQVFLDSDGKIHFPHVDYYLSYGCNLKCEYCALFNPFRSGIVPKEELTASFEGWSQRLVPDEVRLLGGEPFLHPKFHDIAVASKKAWGNSRIVVYTNGVLLPKIEDRVLRFLGEAGIEIRVSQHLNTEEYNRNLVQSVRRFRQFNIRHEIGRDFASWMKFHHVDAHGAPTPCQSNPKVSWSRCHAKHCTSIVADRLYRCSHLLNMILSLNEKAIKPEWNGVLSHQPVTLADSTQEIFRYLRGGVMKECTVCPEVFETVEARQLSLEQIHQIRKSA